MSKSLNKSTISDYRYTLHSLIECSKLNKTILNWDTFNHKFYDDYMSYQVDFKKNSDNLFGKRIKVLKTVLNKAIEEIKHTGSSENFITWMGKFIK